jgi:hypothetical protein
VTGPWLLRRMVRDAGRHRVVWLALAGAFAVAGFCAAGLRLTVLSASASAQAPALPAARIIAYVNDDLDTTAVMELRQLLIKLPGVEGARLVTAREVIDRLRQELGHKASVLDGIDEDLLFPSLEIAVRPASAAALAFRLRRLRGVADVDLVDEGVDSGVDAGVQMADQPAATASTHAHARARVSVAMAVMAACLALWAAIALLRGRVRCEMGVFLSLGLTRGDSLRPLVLLSVGAAALGALAGILAAVGGWRAWIGEGGLPARDWAVGLAALVGVALVLSLAALRAPDAVDAR